MLRSKAFLADSDYPYSYKLYIIAFLANSDYPCFRWVVILIGVAG